MSNDINNLPILKEIEQNLFQELQSVYQNILVSLLEEIDVWLRDHRDFDCFENREMQECIMGTMFGSIKINRRKYVDRETGDRVALLDQYLQSNGSNTLSPFLTEMVVKWAVKEPSYRDARDRFYELLGYQAMSHEKIRQKVLKIEPKSVEDKTKHPKDVDALFLEGMGYMSINKTQLDQNAKLNLELYMKVGKESIQVVKNMNCGINHIGILLRMEKTFGNYLADTYTVNIQSLKTLQSS